MDLLSANTGKYSVNNFIHESTFIEMNLGYQYTSMNIYGSKQKFCKQKVLF